MSIVLSFILVFGAVLYTNQCYAQTRVNIGQFSSQDINGWQQKEFSGQTQYNLHSTDNKFFLSADSQQSASAFYKKIRVNLEQTPVLNWSWSKQSTINPGSELEKNGDDFVARLYVIKDGGFFFWKTLAINYVWSYQHSIDESWDNPFAGSNAKMLSQRDSTNPLDTWFFEKRNIQKDFELLHGKKIDHIDGIAIMTDSDNSGLKAEAFYGDIYFTAE